MRTARFVIGTALVFGWLACVGEDPGSGNGGDPTTGDFNGPCFTDGRCKEGLVCDEQLRRCKQKNGGPDGSPGNDGGPGSEGGPGGCSALTVVVDDGSGVHCPRSATTESLCSSGQLCCPGDTSKLCQPNTGNPVCTNSMRTIQCMSNSQCASGHLCQAISTYRGPSKVAGCTEKQVTLENEHSFCAPPPDGGNDPNLIRLCPKQGSDMGCLGGETCRPYITVANGIAFHINVCE